MTNKTGIEFAEEFTYVVEQSQNHGRLLYVGSNLLLAFAAWKSGGTLAMTAWRDGQARGHFDYSESMQCFMLVIYSRMGKYQDELESIAVEIDRLQQEGV